MKCIRELPFALGLTLLVPQVHLAQTPKFAAPRQIVTGGAGPLVGDFDNDGKTDLLVAVGSQPAPRHMTVLFGDGEGGFSAVDFSPITNLMFPLLVADVNGDGKSDVIVVTFGSSFGSNGAITVFLSKGNGQFTTGAQYPVPYGYYQVVDGDFNNDNKLDFVVNVINEDPHASPYYEQQILFKGHGDGTFATSLLNLTANSGIGDEAMPFGGDFNGDGIRDLGFLVDNFPGPSLYVAYGHGDGTFATPKLVYVADSTNQDLPAVASLNGDRKSDMVLSLAAKQTQGSQPRIATLLAKQTEGFYWASAVSLSNLGFAAVSDLNGDGKPDLIAYGNEAAVSGPPPAYLWVYNGVGGGVFGQKTVVNLSSISTVNVVGLLAVPLARGDLPSLLIEDANHIDILQLLVNTTRP